jgi:hypothetical protein
MNTSTGGIATDFEAGRCWLTEEEFAVLLLFPNPLLRRLRVMPTLLISPEGLNRLPLLPLLLALPSRLPPNMREGSKPLDDVGLVVDFSCCDDEECGEEMPNSLFPARFLSSLLTEVVVLIFGTI